VNRVCRVDAERFRRELKKVTLAKLRA
jgi:hypothetical protein